MDERDLADDPLEQLRRWLDEPRAAVAQPDAMTLATATPDGRPSARVVLLREGRIAFDGPAEVALTAESLEPVYGAPVVVTRSAGYFHVRLA